MRRQGTLGASLLLASVLLGSSVPAKASQVILTGTLDASQVVAPVYQTDANGNQVLDANGNPIVIGSTSTVDGHPVSTSTATGFATVTVDTTAQTITTDLTWSGLSGVANRAHLHDAPAGENRLEPPNNRFAHELIQPVETVPGSNVFDGSTVIGGFVPCFDDPTIVLCAPQSGSLHDVLNLSDGSYFDPTGVYGFVNFSALLSAFQSDGLYLDMHTQLYPGGEIRGQLLAAPVPEPSTIALLAAGFVAVLTLTRRRPGSQHKS
jgi:hypothetical protein